MQHRSSCVLTRTACSLRVAISEGSRRKLHLAGFVAINGKTAAGRALYAKAKAIYAA